MPQVRTPNETALKTRWRTGIRRRLLAWYLKNARKLPWRETSDPYAIWVSEIMLQQTQVATVGPYYTRFLAAFPTVAALAAAPEDRVLRLWEGLGYYRRARQLHAAAKKIIAEHDGAFPRERDAILQLPGIGRYTAGAIMSIAFDARQPILEANTIRLLSRLTEFRGDPLSANGKEFLWTAAECLLPVRDCGSFNQALMELGSLVCTPRNPKCNVCPLSSLCPTNVKGLQQQIPIAKQQPIIEATHEAAVVVAREDGAVLLRKCGHEERWAGLWDFPRFALLGSDPSEGQNAISAAAPLRREMKQRFALKIQKLVHFATLRHQVTRFRITLDCYTARVRTSNSISEKQEVRWIQPKQLAKYPLSVTGRKIAKLICARSKPKRGVAVESNSL